MNPATQQIDLFSSTFVSKNEELKPVLKTHKNGKRMLECQNCGTKFLAVRKNTKYCSSTCRSQHWMERNKMKVITLSVPEDMDDEFINKIKEMIAHYSTESKKPIHDKTNMAKEPSKPIEVSLETEEELNIELRSKGFRDFRVPKHNLGVYYDEKFSITKIEGGFNVKYY
jgi:hypothetical protein